VEVGAWLRTLGLGRYEAAFRESEIDVEVLSDLTDADLEKLGVVMGDRKRLLKAIAGLSSPDWGQPAAKIKPQPHDAAERRQLTVMFCDLVGSTAMSARLDPEDMRAIIVAYHKCCSTLIATNGGFVAKYMGDGVLAYFGYPHAHEHDAEHAVRAGLAIVEAAPKLRTAAGGPLHVRIGIATGIVVVGDLLGSGESQERGVVGDTPNLAARLQGVARPDSVMIAESTRKLLGNLFELIDLGSQDLKGVPGPARAYAVVKESSRENRFEALRAGGLTELVGRDEEAELLAESWSKAKSGEGHVVLLSGEAGIGKSHLIASFMDQLAGEPHALLRYFCSPQHTDSALYPIIRHMERAAGLTPEDDWKTKLDKLDDLLATSSTSPDETAILAEMLSLPNDGRYPTWELTPPQRRHKTLEALTHQIEAMSRESPVLIIFEDVHWADPSSLEAFSQLVDKIEALKVLLFVTFRPEFVAPWPESPHVTALTINHLAPREAMALIEQVASGKPLPDNIREDIVERADGIPLFVEEMTKAVLETEGETAAAGVVAAIPSPALSVPASLHASLMARLDRLGNAKATAQIGAAIGREFSHALLAAVARESEAELASSLDHLVAAGLLYRQGTAPHATYLFKHALIQDTAYGALLREPRRTLHARIVEVLESQFADIAESEPELMARHCVAAGLLENATDYWSKAGQRSLAHSALVEAIGHLTNALTQIAAFPPTVTMRREQIKLQIAIIGPLMHIKGYGAPETIAAAERARLLIEESEALGEPVDDPLLLFAVLYSFWVANYVAFDGDVVRVLATQFLTFAQRQTTIPPLIMGHRLMGTSLLLPGDIAAGREHYNCAIRLYDPLEHRSLTTRLGQDPRVATLCFRSLALWMLGYPEGGLRDAQDALKDAAEIDHVATLMLALFHVSFFHLLRRDCVKAGRLAEQLLTLTTEKGSAFWRSNGTIVRGCALALSNQPEDAVQLITSGIGAFQLTGARVWLPIYLAFLAKARAELGQFEDARRSIDQAMTAAEATKEKWCEAEIHRIAGEIALMPPMPDTARATTCFQRALDIARAQHARSWELRAATSLARLWKNERGRADAYNLLAPIFGRFTEGFDTLDLLEAQTLLAELAF
jgi:class 3 adenylate cyclase/predicted ATPase